MNTEKKMRCGGEKNPAVLKYFKGLIGKRVLRGVLLASLILITTLPIELLVGSLG